MKPGPRQMSGNESAKQRTNTVAVVSGRTHPRPTRKSRKTNHLTPENALGVPSRGHSYRTLSRPTPNARPSLADRPGRSLRRPCSVETPVTRLCISNARHALL